MAIDASVPGSPGWWLLRLGNQLAADQARMDLLDRYASGDHPLPEGRRRHRQMFRDLQRQARTNYVSLVAEAVVERLNVDGFRAGNGEEDKQAWGWWQANSLDAYSGLVHAAAGVFGRAYTMVGKDPDSDGDGPLISMEDPREVIHATDPARPQRVRAALKTWQDEVTGLQHAIVMLRPDSGFAPTSYFVARRSEQRRGSLWTSNVWDVDVDEGDAGTAGSVTGAFVPVVPFINRPRLRSMGLGEFEDVVDVQNRINNTILDRLVIAKMQAYRQRWAKGVKLTDEQNRPIQLDPGADLLWAVEDEKAEFGDFQQADITGILKSIDADVRDLGAITRTPPHYLLAQMTNLSGDALQGAEIGLVAKCQARQRHFGESWEQTMRLAALVEGAEAPDDAEVVWRDAQFRTVSELYDAAVKAVSAGVPWRSRMELLRKTPQEIDRMETERMQDALLMAQFPQLEPSGTPVRYTETTREQGKLPSGGSATSTTTTSAAPGSGQVTPDVNPNAVRP